MNVHPHIFRHPKFIALKRRTPLAMECLVALWGFCQTGQRGENLGKVNPGYVEAICGWTGPEDQLFTALTECGWIRVSKSGDVVVYHWNLHNQALVRSWSNGRLGGRPKSQPANNLQPPHRKTQTEPSETHGLPVGSAGLTQTEPSRTLLEWSGVDQSTKIERGGNTVTVPSLQEVLTWGEFDGVSAETCEAFYNHYTGLGWMYGTTPIRNPRVWLKKFKLKRERVATVRKESVGSLVFQKKTRMEALQQILEEHPAHPNANYANPATAEQRQEYNRFMEELHRLRHELAEGVKA